MPWRRRFISSAAGSEGLVWTFVSVLVLMMFTVLADGNENSARTVFGPPIGIHVIVA
jgi:hypothetical protein